MNIKKINENEYIIPYEIKVLQSDLIDESCQLYKISYSGSLIPKEFFLHEFKKNSEIFKYGDILLKNINNKKINLLYVPNKEWYNLFRIVNYNYN